MEKCWNCLQCSETLNSPDAWKDHFSSSHGTLFSESEFRLCLKIAEKRTPHHIDRQQCPLCLAFPCGSQRNFISHVGKHMESIALAALPRDEDSGSESDSTTSKNSNKADRNPHDIVTPVIPVATPTSTAQFPRWNPTDLLKPRGFQKSQQMDERSLNMPVRNEPLSNIAFQLDSPTNLTPSVRNAYSGVQNENDHGYIWPSDPTPGMAALPVDQECGATMAEVPSPMNLGSTRSLRRCQFCWHQKKKACFSVSILRWSILRLDLADLCSL